MILFHNVLINKFNEHLFNTLVYKNHLTHDTPKVIEYINEFEDEVPLKGWVVKKDNMKYLLPQYNEKEEPLIDKFPFKITTYYETETKSKDVIRRVTGFNSFSIQPLQSINSTELMTIDGIKHQIDEQWMLQKLIAFTSYCRRINIIMSGIKRCGKTSYFESMGRLTDKGYVVKKPRSVKGLSYGLRSDGYIVLDEMGGMNSQQKRVVSDYLYQQGERSSDFKTGKGAGGGVLGVYDVNNQSCIILCNLIEDYKDPLSFIHYTFDNSQAINDRFYPLRMNDSNTPIGRKDRDRLKVYLEPTQFNDDNMELTPEITATFINIIKSLEYYTGEWCNIVDYDYIDQYIPQYMPGRHIKSYREILSGIYIFAVEMEKVHGMGTKDVLFDKFKKLLDKWNDNYYDALDKYAEKEIVEVDALSINEQKELV